MPLKPSDKKSALELSGQKISIRLDKNQGAVHLSRKDGKVKFGPILFWAGFSPKPGDKKFLFSTVVIPGEPELLKNQKTPVGNADLVQWPAELAGCEFIWEIAFFEEEDYALFRLRVLNKNKSPVWVDALSPFSYRGAGDGLELGAGYTVWKFFRLGYQSWSPAGAVDFMEPQPRPKNFLARKLGAAPFLHKRQNQHLWSSEWMAQIVEPELDATALLGFITSKDQTGAVEAEAKYERFRRFEAIADCEGVEVSAGEELCSEWAVAILSDAPRATQKKYFELWAQAMSARKTRTMSGWCSWYYYFEKIDQLAFEKNLEQAKKLNPKIELFQLDEGYESNPGDWLDWHPKFSAGPTQLAEKIHDAGFKAGVWLAPFLASRSSRLFKEHRGWFLKNARGAPVLAMTNPKFKGFLAYALDATNPEFQKWLKELTEKLVHECGFDYLKLDFIYAASLYGKRYDPKATGAAALRKGLEIIREAAGEKTYILGCGAPFGPAIGLADSMRVSEDTDRRWKNPIDLAFGIEIAPAMRSCLKQSMCRSLTGGRLWSLDPDCLILSTGGKLDENDIKAQLTIFYMLAGQMLLSEDLAKLGQQQLDWFSFAVPAPERAAEPIDLFDREFPQELFLAGAETNLLALFNWSDRPQPCRINLLKYGLQKKYHAFEFWSKKYHGEIEGKWGSGKIDPRAVKFFALTEVKDRPQIIGLDFHLGMGKDYAELKTSGKSSKVIAAINLPGKRKGSLYIKFPDQREPKQVAVEFEDKLALEIE